MGNSQSDIKSRFSSRQHLPKHLRPLPAKKLEKLQKKLNEQQQGKSNSSDHKAFIAEDRPMRLAPRLRQEQDMALICSGPRGAFKWFKGRRYLDHSSNPLLPNDQLELDRSRVQTFILRWVFGGNIVAPLQQELEKGIKVLNVSCGPGMWAGHHIIDLALDYRQSHFVAIDNCDLLPDDFEEEASDCSLTSQETSLSSQLTQEEMKIKRCLLKNLDFYQVDVTQERLPFQDDEFDFVKQRLVTASFTLDNWKSVLQELIRVTKPGGYIELIEIDFSTCNLGPKGSKLETDMLEAARRLGCEARIAAYLADALKALNLEDVNCKSVSIPLGEWGLDLGVLWKHNLESFAESTSPVLSQMLNISVTEYKERWRDYFEEVKETKSFTNVYSVWAKVPLDYNPDNIDWSLCPVFKS
ncbi:hypothetical protein RMCBS344292_03599 [Rhizopus microsporus]|nr:hypothetical protein RMCBS344292_03599 [Rhizopus microsporus]